jgi:hypothetical protein
MFPGVIKEKLAAEKQRAAQGGAAKALITEARVRAEAGSKRADRDEDNLHIVAIRRIADLADAFHVAYAPHVGWSGAICAAASVQLAAAQPNFLVYECMIFANPLRENLLTRRVGSFQDLVDGHAAACAQKLHF